MNVKELKRILDKFEDDDWIFICVGNNYYAINEKVWLSKNELTDETCVILDAETDS